MKYIHQPSCRPFSKLIFYLPCLEINRIDRKWQMSASVRNIILYSPTVARLTPVSFNLIFHTPHLWFTALQTNFNSNPTLSVPRFVEVDEISRRSVAKQTSKRFNEMNMKYRNKTVFFWIYSLFLYLLWRWRIEKGGYIKGAIILLHDTASRSHIENAKRNFPCMKIYLLSTIYTIHGRVWFKIDMAIMIVFYCRKYCND